MSLCFQSCFAVILTLYVQLSIFQGMNVKYKLSVMHSICSRLLDFITQAVELFQLSAITAKFHDQNTASQQQTADEYPEGSLKVLQTQRLLVVPPGGARDVGAALQGLGVAQSPQRLLVPPRVQSCLGGGEGGDPRFICRYFSAY